jgi:hypothetical protein
VSIRNPLPSRYTRDIKFNSSHTREIFIIEPLDRSAHSFTHLLFTLQFSPSFLRTANATSQTRVIGHLGLRRGSSRLWFGHPHVTSCGGRSLPITSLCSSRMVMAEVLFLAEAFFMDTLLTEIGT